MHWTLPFGIEPFSAEFLGLVVREKDGHECEFGYVVEWQTLKCDKQWKLRWRNIEIKLFSWTVFAIEDSKSRMIYDIQNNQGRGKCYQPTRRPRLITLTETLIIQDITKTESKNCFIIHCFEENNDKHTIPRNLSWYCYWKSCTASATYTLVTYLLADD